ncbi:MAG: hypothetical protein MMC33_008662 [Icmadophila ericetorum]|nr:hypothetical protein [Icmadophila ericetorum]
MGAGGVVKDDVSNDVSDDDFEKVLTEVDDVNGADVNEDAANKAGANVAKVDSIETIDQLVGEVVEVDDMATVAEGADGEVILIYVEAKVGFIEEYEDLNSKVQLDKKTFYGDYTSAERIGLVRVSSLDTERKRIGGGSCSFAPPPELDTEQNYAGIDVPRDEGLHCTAVTR